MVYLLHSPVRAFAQDYPLGRDPVLAVAILLPNRGQRKVQAAGSLPPSLPVVVLADPKGQLRVQIVPKIDLSRR